MHDTPVRPLLNDPDDASRPTPQRPIAWNWFAVALVPLTIAYLLMLNPYWVPSGDGDMYTCVARSLARGQGLIFNGARAAIEPPGWPIVLSLAMRISPTFLFLKLVQISCMLAAMGISFLIVRRFVSDRMTAGVILLTGTLSVLYPLTFWMHTEAFFCLLGFGAMLIAFRVRDGIARKWEPILLLVLLGYAAFTRWSGVLYLAVLIPILLSSSYGIRWRLPTLPTRWKPMVGLSLAVFVVGVGTFAGTHRALRLTHAETELAITRGANQSDDSGDASGQPTEVTAVPGTVTEDMQTPDLDTFKTHRSRLGEIIYRITTAGKWFAWLLWQPTRFGQSVSLINIAGMIFGWLSIGLLVITALVRTLRHRDYFWLGLAAYTGGLCIFWPNPNARYFVPVAPFIVLGVFLGIRAIREFGLAQPKANDKPDAIARLLARRSAAPMAVAFTVATLGSNLPLMAIDVYVFRSSDFYGAYEAGSNKELLIAASIINAVPFDGRIGVSERYDNLGHSRFSPFAKRALHLLCDREVVGVPRKDAGKPTSNDTAKWARHNNCLFYVFQEAWWPWRVWHFRLSPSFQARLGKRMPAPKSPATTLATSMPAKPSATSAPSKLATTVAVATAPSALWSSFPATSQPLVRAGPAGTSGGWQLWIRDNLQVKRIGLSNVNPAQQPGAYPTRVPGL